MQKQTLTKISASYVCLPLIDNPQALLYLKKKKKKKNICAAAQVLLHNSMDERKRGFVVWNDRKMTERPKLELHKKKNYFAVAATAAAASVAGLHSRLWSLQSARCDKDAIRRMVSVQEINDNQRV